MKRNIWYFHHYSTPPTMNGLTRPYYFGKELLRNGYNIKVFSSSFLHYSSQNLIKDKSDYLINNYSEIPYVFLKTSSYRGSGFSRLWNMFLFYLGLIRISKKLSFTEVKPDILIASSPHPLTLFAGIRLAKKYNVPCICEVRDLWPESFLAYNVINKSNPLLKLLYAGEKWLYKKADKIVFTMEGGKDYIIDKGWDKDKGGPIDINMIEHINNGVDIEEYQHNKKNYILKDEDLNGDYIFKVVYAGSIRKVNNVKKIVEVAKIIKEKGYEKIKFLIFGDGTEKEDLNLYCSQNNIDNVIFKGFVNKKYIPFILSKCDLNILHFEQNSLKKYGASLNKMFEYFASGKPTVSDCEFGYDLIKRYKCGKVVDNANAEQFAEIVLQFYNMSEEEYKSYCQNALKAAKEYDFKKLTQKLENIILELI